MAESGMWPKDQHGRSGGQPHIRVCVTTLPKAMALRATVSSHTASGGGLPMVGRFCAMQPGVPLFLLTQLDLPQIPLRVAQIPQAGEGGHPPKPECQASTREALRTGARETLTTRLSGRSSGEGWKPRQTQPGLSLGTGSPLLQGEQPGAGGQSLAAARGSLTCLRPPKGISNALIILRCAVPVGKWVWILIARLAHVQEQFSQSTEPGARSVSAHAVQGTSAFPPHCAAQRIRNQKCRVHKKGSTSPFEEAPSAFSSPEMLLGTPDNNLDPCLELQLQLRDLSLTVHLEETSQDKTKTSTHPGMPQLTLPESTGQMLPVLLRGFSIATLDLMAGNSGQGHANHPIAKAEPQSSEKEKFPANSVADASPQYGSGEAPTETPHFLTIREAGLYLQYPELDKYRPFPNSVCPPCQFRLRV
ncbi:hypothetical protein DV515_00004305 [Chloebia gouldiae]|uniref:Uncharacterized protein n=1 Tax=Chloebia gouldiae TaxID=44316 RepID=A0A3L8SRV1_CHLGU|nr:hypothetical protein DV515_00004305 [Chloebia gouldiae]